MPEICRFFGIVIRMYYDEHEPPHFHAIYSGMEVQIGINPIEVLQGNLPRRALSMVVEWAALHQHELMDNWNNMRMNETPVKIEPLAVCRREKPLSLQSHTNRLKPSPMTAQPA